MTSSNVTFDVLVSTMHQKGHTLLEKMNIQSNAIVINQCDRYEFEEIEYNGNHIKFLSFAERGIGLSRNIALMRSTADICLFADDDVVYVDNYEKIIINAFLKKPEADMIIFNVPCSNEDRNPKKIINEKKLHLHNAMSFGTYRIAIRRNGALKNGIYFSLMFGGGAKYSAGEDSLFISDFFKKGCKVYSDPSIIGYVDHKESTWFNGYNDKYFIDKGVFFYTISKKFGRLLCLQYVLRKYKLFQNEKTRMEALKLMLRGVKK